ncbi:MAG: histidinol-phosphatase HisJ family protein [Ruminococcaceae bacterium]|nr:histidinol-phosphatase HisJ family protein [Oscillospiraceae bacterium]
MILSDFHTHTTFSDGQNTAEEMLLHAISMGLEAIGFSDHASGDNDYSMKKEDILPYRREIAHLKEKYQGQIEILCGIELDADGMDRAEPYDYAIASVHHITVRGKEYAVDLSPEETLRMIREGFGGNFDSYAEAYYEKLTDYALRSGANIVGHFDLLTKFSEGGVPFDAESPRYQAAWQAALSALTDKLVFEINTGAISRGYRTAPYPAFPILTELCKMGGKVLLSGDAHKTDSLCAHFEDAKTLLLAHGFTKAGFTDRHGKYHAQI